jgi:proteasome lid subunit RPN8/RPN11
VSTPLTITHLEEAGLMDSILAQARNKYPSECCGLVLEDQGQLSLIPCENLQDSMHAKDPEAFSRTSATAYFIDPKVVMDNEAKMRCIYHSHPDHGAYFSEEDQLVAAPFGEPNFPDTSYLVVSVMKGEIAEKNVFLWDESTEQFEPATEGE